MGSNGHQAHQSGLIATMAEMEQWNAPGHVQTPDSLQKDLDQGLRFAHVMMSITQHDAREGLVFARSLAELLVSKGLIDQQELEEMMSCIGRQLDELPTPKVRLAKSEDKYAGEHTVLINCAERLPLCKAKCCTFSFYLTEQDLDEGIVRWDYRRPYWIRRRADGYCTHCDPLTHRCGIHAHRPYVCRAYDCRQDKRVWLDFERMIPNSEG
ncbi:MAG: YkgJ family cysteine cluster protein [Chloroflexi bacterium]|nr:YkgJ family cysteine cluster protein [Chloroflexota bacterium]